MTMKHAAALVPALCLLLAACAPAPELVPAPAARGAGAAADVAVTTAAGVRVAADAGAWSGLAIGAEVTPLQVRIENDSGRRLRVRYDAFALVAESGRTYHALPPFAIEGAAYRPLEPRFYHRGFYPAPHHAHHFPSLAAARAFHHDPLVYGRYYRRWEPLPTARMLEHALPEGVLEPGGVVSGFLYLERVDPGPEAVTLRVDLVDVGGEPFAEARLPFRVAG